MNLIKIVYPICATALFAAGCAKKLDEVYINGNSPVRVPVETLLPGIISNFNANSAAAGSAYGMANDGINVGRYIQNWGANAAANQFDQMGGATGASDAMGSVWAMQYFGQGLNLSRMIEWSIDEKKYDYAGVGYAIRAWGWLVTTNMYGEIIVNDAFKTQETNFRFDEQKVAYQACRDNARLALQYLNRTDGVGNTANLQLGDAFMNNGDLNKWRRFVYGVLARSFNQLSNKAEYNADSVLFFANQGPQTNDHNTVQRFAATGIVGTSNFYGPFRNNVGALRQTNYIANLLLGNNAQRFRGIVDPRIGHLLQNTPGGGFTGVTIAQGYTSTLATNAVRPKSFWGLGGDSTTAPLRQDSCRYIFRNESPYPIITAPEMQFIIAEAQYRKNNKAAALAAYTQGVSLAIDLVSSEFGGGVANDRRITPSSKAAYMASANVIPPNPADLTLSHIMMQKYIALYGWGALETWVDMRRYHYIDAEPGTNFGVYADFFPPSGNNLFTVNNGKFVYRARPRFNSEYLYNLAELQRLGATAADYHTKEQWFSLP